MTSVRRNPVVNPSSQRVLVLSVDETLRIKSLSRVHLGADRGFRSSFAVI